MHKLFVLVTKSRSAVRVSSSIFHIDGNSNIAVCRWVERGEYDT
jgi:hypothetical protein